MRKIAFHIQKGGVGKTTMAGNVAAELRHFQKTVLVDCDPQGNLTSWFMTEPMRYDLADILQEKAGIRAAIKSIRERLDLLPTFAIDGQLKEWGETKLQTKPFAFRGLVDDLESIGYEVAIFDLGPGISLLERSILACMDEVVGIAKAEYFSFDGIEIFLHEIDRLRKDFRAQIEARRLVVNMVNGSFNVHRAYASKLQEINVGGGSFELYMVSQSTKLTEAVTFHKSIFEHDPGNRTASEIQRLAADLSGIRVGA